jgi:hypothetical protein
MIRNDLREEEPAGDDSSAHPASREDISELEQTQ